MVKTHVAKETLRTARDYASLRSRASETHYRSSAAHHHFDLVIRTRVQNAANQLQSSCFQTLGRHPPCPPGTHQVISVPPRHEMEVDVEYRLPSCALVGLHHCQPIGADGSVDEASHSRRETHERTSGVRFDIEKRSSVGPWDHERVALSCRSNVKKRNRTCIFENDVCRFGTLCNVTKRAGRKLIHSGKSCSRMLCEVCVQRPPWCQKVFPATPQLR